MKLLQIKFKNIDDLFNDVIDGSGINEPHTIFYSNREEFNRSLTQQKIQIIGCIANKKPNSISHLSKLIISIARERMSKICNELEMEGYIKFEEAGHGGKTPVLAFDYDLIYVEATEGSSSTIFSVNEVTPASLKKLDFAKEA